MQRCFGKEFTHASKLGMSLSFSHPSFGVPVLFIYLCPLGCLFSFFLFCPFYLLIYTIPRIIIGVYSLQRQHIGRGYLVAMMIRFIGVMLSGTALHLTVYPSFSRRYVRCTSDASGTPSARRSASGASAAVCE